MPGGWQRAPRRPGRRWVEGLVGGEARRPRRGPGPGPPAPPPPGPADGEPLEVLGTVAAWRERGGQATLSVACTLAGYEGTELLLPLVGEVVPLQHPGARVLYAEPPEGLLELARLDAAEGEVDVVDEVARALEPHVRSASLPDGSLHLAMPTREELLARGEHGLVYRIHRLGGFQEVALLLGIQPKKRPAGWWNLENLEAEVAAFMSVLWTEIADPDTGETYYFHQVTGEQKDRPPNATGSRSSATAMPTSSAVKAAGRWDLHYGIVENGGYAEVGRQLGRKPIRQNWYLEEMLGSFEATAREALRAMQEIEDLTGEAQTRLPTMRTLRDLGLTDLERAIQHHGGFAKVAARMGVPPRHRPRGYWKDIRHLQVELIDFIEAREGELDGDTFLPTLEELRAAGRHDLRYALQLHGSSKVATLLGLNIRRRAPGAREAAGD